MFDQKAILLTALLQIQQEVLVPGEGICYNVEMATFNTEGADDLAMNRMMSDLWVKWPEFSSHGRYPVPFKDRDPKDTFHGTSIMWESIYGESRKRLLTFLIAELQKDSE